MSTPRGLAVKIIGVDGERLAGSEGDVTQDFVLVNGPAFGAATAQKFLPNLKLVAATTDRAEGLKKLVSAFARGTEALEEPVRHGGIVVTDAVDPEQAQLIEAALPALEALGAHLKASRP